MTWLGDTPADRRMSLKLALAFVALSPLILCAEIAARLRIPCQGGHAGGLPVPPARLG